MRLPDEVAGSPLFEGVDDRAREIAAQAFRTIILEAGQTVFEAGDDGHALYVIGRGLVKVFHNNLDGKEKMLAHLGPGEVFGEMSLVDESPRSATALVVKPALLHALYLEEYLGLINRYPLVAHNLARILARRLREMNREVEVLTFEESRGKVAYALLKLYRQGFGEEGECGRIMRMTQRELADIAGTSRETITRVVSEFNERGYVRSAPGFVEVCDSEALEKVLYDLE